MFAMIRKNTSLYLRYDGRVRSKNLFYQPSSSGPTSQPHQELDYLGIRCYECFFFLSFHNHSIICLYKVVYKISQICIYITCTIKGSWRTGQKEYCEYKCLAKNQRVKNDWRTACAFGYHQALSQKTPLEQCLYEPQYVVFPRPFQLLIHQCPVNQNSNKIPFPFRCYKFFEAH